MKKRTIINTMQKLDSLSLPEKEKILAVCDAVVPEAPAEAKASPVRRRVNFRIAVTAAMMAALLLVGGGVTVLANEAKAYNEAMDFFEEYNLSAEGFSRSEIKKIYRDIVSESFTYEKTEAALASGLVGYEIQSKPLDSDGLKRLWLLGYTMKSADQQLTGEEGVRYAFNQVLISTDHSHGEVIKIKDDKWLWRKTLDDIVIFEVRPVGDKVMVAGLYNGENDPKNDPLVRVYLLDSNSTVIWCKDYDSRMPRPNVHYILYQNGNCVLFCDSFYSDYMWILTIDMDGNYVSDRYTAYDSRGEWVKKVVPVGDTYLMLKGDQLMQEKDGRVQNTVNFGTETENYQITDMVEFNGLVYLSGRIVPKSSGKNQKDILDRYIQRFGETLCTGEELTEFFREQYTAVLLICDPDSGEPRQFYTVPGASGSSLEVKDDKLSWNVNRYADAEHIGNTFEKAQACYNAGGGFGLIKADVWRYVFNPFGQVVGEKDTGKSVDFENWHY